VNVSIVVRPEVDADLRQAEVWYEQQEPGLGRKFLQDVVGTIERLLQNPSYTKYVIRDARYVGPTLANFRIESFSVQSTTL
jgi:hypothetical protein